MILQPLPCAWSATKARIEASLQRLCELMAPVWGEADIECLQALTDGLLTARPALCAESLEHRLDCLCVAAEELGRWADLDEIVARAVALTAKHN